MDKVPDTDLSGYVGQAMTSVGQAAGAASAAATQAADAVGQAVNRGDDTVDLNPDELEFDDQGALSGAIPEGETADVAASVRESLPDETGRQ